MRITFILVLAVGAVISLADGPANAQTSGPPLPRPETPPAAGFGAPVAHGMGSPPQATLPPGSPSQAQPENLDPRLKALVERLVAERVKDEMDKQKQEAAKKLEDEKSQGVVVGSQPTGGTVSWRNGFWFETPNKDFSFHIGGTLQYDLGLYTVSPNLTTGLRTIGPVEDGVNPRRGRLRAEGTVWENIDYRFELEFFNGINTPGGAPAFSRLGEQQTILGVGPTDAWITIKNLPVMGNVRVGNQKEPIGLDHLEGYRFLPFMERSPLFDFNTPTAFNNGFNPGIQFFDTAFQEHMTWAIGVFKNSYNVGGFAVDDGDYAVTGRLTWLPFYEQNGAYMVHLGVAGSHRDPEFDQDRFRVRPSVRSGPGPITTYIPILTDTGVIDMTSQDIVALEFFANAGPLTVQAEYMGTWNSNSKRPDKVNVGTTYFQGCYVQALYWLTGEYTRWDKKAAAPDRYVVNNPFFVNKTQEGWFSGTGAWQVGARYGFIDSNDRGINGGILDDWTLGVNWILNPNVKFQWNYEFAHRHGLGDANNGDFQAFGMRLHFDF